MAPETLQTSREAGSLGLGTEEELGREIPAGGTKTAMEIWGKSVSTGSNSVSPLPTSCHLGFWRHRTEDVKSDRGVGVAVLWRGSLRSLRPICHSVEWEKMHRMSGQWDWHYLSWRSNLESWWTYTVDSVEGVRSELYLPHSPIPQNSSDSGKEREVDRQSHFLFEFGWLSSAHSLISIWSYPPASDLQGFPASSYVSS